MRTLKKTLSLVLVVAMVLGLCVVGASAYNKVEDFTDDVSKIGDAYYEAVGVLTGIGVIDGMTETAFEPQGTYTREQAAKIIAYMMLGKDKADSLGCTAAPFADVAANRWSAGYIAFCVEQGIIDGMTETTFEPTGTLTGFQWAKMLLCAVGFGVNDEFTGSSWSVNTAKVAHTVDLFKGDLAGADHTALTREQAALYAFNVLTNVKKVAYSPNVTNYVFGIGGYEVVGGIGSTLGKDVFGLVPYTGIITANEGTGAKYTTLSKGYAGSALVANLDADTGIDMMYHAARIWAVNGVSVFVYDLAKTTVASCTAIPAAVAANASKVGANTLELGKKTGTELYEYAFIDNSAYNKSYAGVSFYYDTGVLGVTDSVKKTTVIGGTAVSSAKIWTDISDIAKFSTVIYLVEGGIYYVETISSTSGTVKDYDNAKKTITLTDGTTLSASAFYDEAYLTADNVKLIIGNTYTFVLDSHGHFMDITRAGIANLYYYTGEWQITSNFNSYHGEHTYTAQFYNVTTGEPVDLTVLSSFIYDSTGKKLRDPGFYDLGVADASGVYYPGTDKNTGFVANEAVVEHDNLYAGKYAVVNSLVLTATDTYVDVKTGNSTAVTGSKRVYLDKDATYIIASGTGSKVSTTTYNSLAELVAAYKGTSVTLTTAALTVYNSSTNNAACNVVFGYVGNYIAGGSNLFLPTAINLNNWKTEWVNGSICYRYDGFYLNGLPQSVTIKEPFKANMSAGFYTYTITDGVWEITAQSTGYDYIGIAKVTSSSGRTWLDDDLVSDNAVVVDCRAAYIDTAEEIDTVDKLVAKFDQQSIRMAYTIGSTGVNVIYILEEGWAETTTVSLSAALVNAGWRLYDGTVDGTTSLSYKDTKAASSYKLFNIYVDLPDSNFDLPVTVTENDVKVADVRASYDNGYFVVNYTPTAASTANTYNVNVVFGGLTNESPISFAVDSSLANLYDIANTTKTYATGTYVFGTPVTVDIKVLFDTNGNPITLTFENQYKASANISDIVVENVKTIDNDGTYQTVTVTIYPGAHGTYTLSAADWYTK